MSSRLSTGSSKLLPQLRASLPPTVEVTLLTDRTVTIRASVKDVEIELGIAVGLVVAVIFLFLRSTAATLIPSVVVPLSLVGTFGFLYLAGFSINNLTLMALTIATGFVVDDAIVMIENIMRYVEAGDDPHTAALKGAEQIGFTIISLTVSLIAVLIPLLFMGDVVGRLFREFAITLAVAILISAVISLTLTPMMCARLLRQHETSNDDRFQRASAGFFEAIVQRYGVDAGLGPRPSADDLAGGHRHAGPHVRVVRHHPQGILPDAGHRHHPGYFRGVPVDFVCRNDGASAGVQPSDPAGPGGARACRPTLAWTASTRRSTAAG